MSHIVSKIVSLCHRGTEEMRNRTLSGLASSEQTPSDDRKSSLAFKDISATTIAEQLTYLEYRMLRRIPVSSSYLFFMLSTNEVILNP